MTESAKKKKKDFPQCSKNYLTQMKLHQVILHHYWTILQVQVKQKSEQSQRSVVFSKYKQLFNMQRSRLCCKRLDLFTKRENLEASRWGSSQDCQGVFIAAISSLNNCFWLDHYGGAVFKGESFGFVRRKKLEQIIAFKESNFVNVYFFFFSYLTKYHLTNIRYLSVNYATYQTHPYFS